MSDDQAFDTDPSLEELETARKLFDDKSYSEAAKAYLKLADDPYGRAVYLRLGWMCEWGMGLEKDPQKAKYWYERAADAGLPENFEANDS